VTTPDPFSDAFSIIQTQLAAWGLDTLASSVHDMLVGGNSAPMITLKLQQTPEYKKRFAANDARTKAGLPVLSPAEYISAEQSYKNVLREGGLPSGFYDNQDDFNQFLSKDVSPAELGTRVKVAQQQYLQASPEMKSAWSDYYGLTPGHAIASILDPDTALPLLQKQAQTVEIAAARRQAFGGPTGAGDQSQDELLQNRGVNAQQAQKGFQNIAQRQGDDTLLAHSEGRDGPTMKDQVGEELLGDQKAAAARQANIQQSQAAFKGNYSGQQGGFFSDAAGNY
jgi:hypothetical protein